MNVDEAYAVLAEEAAKFLGKRAGGRPACNLLC